MKRDHRLFIKDIISAMKSIEEFVEGLSLDEVREDDKTSSAVIRKFEIIGEAEILVELQKMDVGEEKG